MIPAFQQLRASLDALQPGAFNAALAALLFVALWLVRKRWPLFFAKLPPALQAWPAMTSGAVLAVLSTDVSGSLSTSIVNALGMALTGLVSGVMSVGVHRVLKESPTPYGVDQIPPKKDAAPLVPPTITRISGLLVFLIAFVPGCTRFMHFSDPTTDDYVSKLCDTLGTEQAAAIQAEADRQKISFDDVKHLFDVACVLRVKRGLEPARASGMAAARHETEVAP